MSWLDRYRHALAVVVTVALTPLAILRMSEVLVLDWRSIQIILGVALGTIIWVIAELVLATIAAAWEVRCERRATREVPTLPVARVVSPRYRP